MDPSRLSCGAQTSEVHESLSMSFNLQLHFLKRSRIIDPHAPDIGTVQRPTNVKWLENVALRDLVLHEHHAACVDSRGDVYQWGDGFFGSGSAPDAEARKPKATLVGKVGVFMVFVDFLCQTMLG